MTLLIIIHHPPSMLLRAFGITNSMTEDSKMQLHSGRILVGTA